MPGEQRKRVHDVFGISNEVLPDSYVDRGKLDNEVRRLLARPTHVALRGESKCGKSWLRQRVVPGALTVQCRLGRTVRDIYTDALSQIDIHFQVKYEKAGEIRGHVTAKSDFGSGLIDKVFGFRAGVEAGAEGAVERRTEASPVGRDIEDLRYIAELIKVSGRRLVIEDFHYLSIEQRKSFAFDLKALWDYGLFVIIVGVWSQSNMLIYLNPDLTGRVEEVPIAWADPDLEAVLQKGGQALRLGFSPLVTNAIIGRCYGNVGILQTLAQRTLDVLGIEYQQDSYHEIVEMEALDDASMQYADQLNPLYQQFAKRVSSGIRRRVNATGIYAHAMAVILQASDDELIAGFSLGNIFKKCHERESRIQQGNLKTVLEKFEQLQVDDAGRGLVLAYNEASGEVTAVDRQLLLYRRYATVAWPWEDLIREAGDAGYSLFEDL